MGVRRGVGLVAIGLPIANGANNGDSSRATDRRLYSHSDTVYGNADQAYDDATAYTNLRT